MKASSITSLILLIFTSTQASCTRTEYAGGEAFEVHFEENKKIGNCSLNYLWKNHNTTWDEVLENIDKCVLDAGGYDSINPVRTVSNNSFEPKTNLDIILYALVDLDNNVLGVDTNASNLEYIKNNKSNTLSKRETLEVVPVTECFTDRYKPHEELVKRGMAYDHGPLHARDKRFWSTFGKYAFYYLSGAVTLKILEKLTNSWVVGIVYSAYVSIAGYLAYALGDIIEVIAQQFRQARQDRSRRGPQPLAPR
ncbi:hypothetical protein HYPBUDRAFT_210836 [Hyphopichia burtonii NRRL Y-1933]|uniref:Autophagy-related protein 27 n=1 Tax=Hyphopichia burtonii NRRL Y-1933 TaxID=984485 RepID=A0A1E4RG67_9ASCO|nr:hypothetical protein HYPBUDRAFT_210836 [Hyphopichia burtonii NRRL Y-1933]ODV66262.1 hypothetical protein HYPBUDRAFT_210836 [Hyphopichia burtonii NRRL Y-1933]